jgi:adenine/guanine phosphoribosyltransferase-like PRPP-binding protein
MSVMDEVKTNFKSILSCIPLMVKEYGPSPVPLKFDNVAGAFIVPKRHHAKLEGKTVLLVDDVFTTGATAEACSKALKQAGAAKVHFITLSRVVSARNPTI